MFSDNRAHQLISKSGEWYLLFQSLAQTNWYRDPNQSHTSQDYPGTKRGCAMDSFRYIPGLPNRANELRRYKQKISLYPLWLCFYNYGFRSTLEISLQYFFDKNLHH